MDWLDSDSLNPSGSGPLSGVNTDLVQMVAAAADLCRKPLRHGVVVTSREDDTDCCLNLEVRNAHGERIPQEDLELEIFRSGSDRTASVHLTLAWLHDEHRPMLWQGQHPVWMDSSGLRCERPEDGAVIEALARRLRALLADLS